MTKVALVDDHEMLRSGLAGLINTFPDFKVISEAGHGREFIDNLNRDELPDIVLLDITMPVMDGYETALWIKNELPNTKILVLSMLSNDMAIIRMLRNGVKGYILKESKPAILKQAMESIIKNDFYVNELVKDKLVNYITNDKDKDLNTTKLLNITESEVQFLQSSRRQPRGWLHGAEWRRCRWSRPESSPHAWAAQWRRPSRPRTSPSAPCHWRCSAFPAPAWPHEESACPGPAGKWPASPQGRNRREYHGRPSRSGGFCSVGRR